MPNNKIFLYMIDIVLSAVICIIAAVFLWYTTSNAEYESIASLMGYSIAYCAAVVAGFFALFFPTARNRSENKERISIYIASANIAVGLACILHLLPAKNNPDIVILAASQLSTLIGIILYFKIFST